MNGHNLLILIKLFDTYKCIMAQVITRNARSLIYTAASKFFMWLYGMKCDLNLFVSF